MQRDSIVLSTTVHSVPVSFASASKKLLAGAPQLSQTASMNKPRPADVLGLLEPPPPASFLCSPCRARCSSLFSAPVPMLGLGALRPPLPLCSSFCSCLAAKDVEPLAHPPAPRPSSRPEGPSSRARSQAVKRPPELTSCLRLQIGGNNTSSASRVNPLRLHPVNPAEYAGSEGALFPLFVSSSCR